MQINHGGTNKLPNKLRAMEIKIDTLIYWRMKKTSRKTITLPGEFQVTTLKNPLIKNKRLHL